MAPGGIRIVNCARPRRGAPWAIPDRTISTPRASNRRRDRRRRAGLDDRRVIAGGGASGAHARAPQQRPSCTASPDRLLLSPALPSSAWIHRRSAPVRAGRDPQMPSELARCACHGNIDPRKEGHPLDATIARPHRVASAMPARVAHSAHQQLFHLPRDWPWELGLDELFRRALHPARPRSHLTTAPAGSDRRTSGTAGQTGGSLTPGHHVHPRKINYLPAQHRRWIQAQGWSAGRRRGRADR